MTLQQFVCVFLGIGIVETVVNGVRYRRRRHLRGTVVTSSEGDMWVHDGWEFVATTPEEQRLRHDPKYRLG